MKRQISKSLVDQAKLDLREKIIKRIVKDANSKGCWHLKSVNESKIVDAVCHFRDRGTKKIFFKANFVDIMQKKNVGSIHHRSL